MPVPKEAKLVIIGEAILAPIVFWVGTVVIKYIRNSAFWFIAFMILSLIMLLLRFVLPVPGIEDAEKVRNKERTNFTIYEIVSSIIYTLMIFLIILFAYAIFIYANRPSATENVALFVGGLTLVLAVMGVILGDYYIFIRPFRKDS